MQAFSIRGWVPFGIEVNSCASESSRLIKGDFESYSFPERVKYDLVWMNHVLPNFKDPAGALRKAYDLLQPNGLLFIAVPDSDMMYTNSQAAFFYWRKHEYYIMWNKQTLTRQLQNIGYEIILTKRNYENRFAYQDDLHIIAQKKFF